MHDDDPRVKELRDLAYRLSNFCNKPGSRMPQEVQKAARKLSSKVQAYCSDVEYIAEPDFVERKAMFEKLINVEVEKCRKAEEAAVEDSKSKCYRGLGGGEYEIAYLEGRADPKFIGDPNAPLSTSKSKREQALTADEVANRCQDDPEALFLCDVGIGDTDIDALCAGLKRAGQKLTTLDISSNQIADAGIQKLTTGFAGGMCPNLTELYIGCNAFGEQGRCMLDGGLVFLRKGLTIHADNSVGQSPAQELGGTAFRNNWKPEVVTAEQEARSGDIEGPASNKKKSPTGGDTGALPNYNDMLKAAKGEAPKAKPEKAAAEDAGKVTDNSAFSGSATIVEGAEGQEVHVVIPLAGSSVSSAADLELDISASEVRISGPGGLSVSVLLPDEVEPSSAQPSFSKKRQQLVVKLKVR